MSPAPPAVPSFWRRRVVDPVLAQLRQGVSPQQIALTLTLGTVLGIFPILGTTTLLCLVAGIWLRLNQPILQLVNYLVYPLQLALLLPFYRAGEWLFDREPVPIFAVADLTARFQADPAQFFADYGMVGVYGVVVWLLVAPVSAGLLYLILRPLLARLAVARRPA